MRTKEPFLSRARQVEHRSAVQQLQAWGLIPTTPDQLESSSALDTRVNAMASEISELPSGQTYYAISVELVARRPNIIVDCHITTSWDDQILLGSDEVKSLYRPEGPVYASDGALNQRIESGLRFHRRGDMVRGALLACGLRPIPGAYRNDSILPFESAFTDSLGNRLSTHS